MPQTNLGNKSLAILFLALTASGCSSRPIGEKIDSTDAWYEDISIPEKDRTSGSIYDGNRHGLLLGVGNKYGVGDLIVIEVDEETMASDKTKNENTKDSTYSHGLGINIDDDSIIGADMTADSSSSFTGEGNTEKSHSLTGDVTVVVKKILNNGNLVVEGSKKVELSNGSEIIGIRGIIREADVSTINNRISSGKVANAYIYYKGEGDRYNAGTPGFLTRFLQSRWWIF